MNVTDLFDSEKNTMYTQ